MSKLLLSVVLCALLVVFVEAIDNEFSHCHCDDEGVWSIHSIMECQKVSDFLIAVAYFSIPLELLYFVSFSNVPFKWVLVQFIAFIVLCGLTHLLNGWTYYGPHSFQLMMALTIAKILTALVSCATAITLLTLIPLLLKLKVKELYLTQDVLALDQEVVIMKKQKEASWHVRMLTQEIRKSLDKHTILYTTLVELSNTLDLYNCAVWMPNENRTEMNLTHQLKANNYLQDYCPSLPINDPDVLEITKNKGVRILNQHSALGISSNGGCGESGPVAAIRMPLLRVSNFKGGTPELVETHYAILVLVLRSENDRNWSFDEMEIVEVVADQVAVALSHASVLEESQLMRKKLGEQNRVLQQAKENAMMASQARNSFQKVMSHGMRRPMHSILGLLSMFQEENLSSEKKTIVDTMVKTSTVLSTLINDVMELSASDSGRFPLETKPFQLHYMIKEVSCLFKCLCIYKGFGFLIDVPSSLPNHVIGDERRTFQVLLHMVGHLLDVCDGSGSVILRIISDCGTDTGNELQMGVRRSTTTNDFTSVKFEIEVSYGGFRSDGSVSTIHFGDRRYNGSESKEGLSFNMCKRLVQMMQGNIWISSNSHGHAQSMTLLLKFQIDSVFRRFRYELGNSEQAISNLMFKGLHVVLADDDDINRMVTRKLLEKLGCHVTAVSSGFECMSALAPSVSSCQVVILDLQMPGMDGFEVAMRIRKFRSRHWPLIIALTASAEENIWERCLHAEINGLIRKPILLQGLAEELRRVLLLARDMS